MNVKQPVKSVRETDEKTRADRAAREKKHRIKKAKQRQRGQR